MCPEMVGEGLVLYRNIFRELKKEKCQTEITIYFCKVTMNVIAFLYSLPPPSLFPPLLPLKEQNQPSFPPPPQPTQHEDNEEDKDFNDDPPPFNE